MTDPVSILNARLGERLGYRSGNNPRFAWKWAPDLHYYWRDNVTTSFVRQCWADQLGPVWVLCQWRRPEMSKEQWWTSFKGEFPYPDRGMYYAHPETALDLGMKPTADITASHTRALEIQVEKKYADHLREVNERAETRKQKDDDDWDDYIQDWAPAFDVWNSGKKSGVEFQVPGLRPDRVIQRAIKDSPELREHGYVTPDGGAVSGAHYL